MKTREYIVGHTSSTDTKEIVSFFVTDCVDDEELQSGKRPTIAVFPVSQLYEAQEQEYRAIQYAEFMNKINEATQKAYEQTMLMDILKK